MNGFILALAPSMLALTMIAPLPVVPQIVREFGQHDQLVALALTLPILGAACSGLLLGLAGNRVPRRRAFILGALVFAIAGPAPAMLNSLPLILVARGVAGLSLGIMASTGLGLVGDLFEGPRRTFWLAAQASIPSAAAIVAAVAGGALGAWGWRAPFALLLAGGGLFALSLTLLRPTLEASAGAAPARLDGAPSHAVLVVLLVAAAGSLLIFYPAYEFGFLLAERGQSSPMLIGAMTAAMGTGAVLGASSLGLLRGAPALTAIALCLASACLGQLGVVVGVQASWLGLAALLAGLGQGLFTPVLSTWLLDLVAEAERGRAVATFQATLLTSQFAAPHLARTIARTVGSAVHGMIVLAIASGIFAAVLMGWRLRRKK